MLIIKARLDIFYSLCQNICDVKFTNKNYFVLFISNNWLGAFLIKINYNNMIGSLIFALVFCGVIASIFIRLEEPLD